MEKKETGSYGTGGRMDYENYLGSDNWKTICDEAIRQAEVNLDSKPAPAGEMKVVLGPGWPGSSCMKLSGTVLKEILIEKNICIS